MSRAQVAWCQSVRGLNPADIGALFRGRDRGSGKMKGEEHVTKNAPLEKGGWDPFRLVGFPPLWYCCSVILAQSRRLTSEKKAHLEGSRTLHRRAYPLTHTHTHAHTHTHTHCIAPISCWQVTAVVHSCHSHPRCQ